MERISRYSGLKNRSREMAQYLRAMKDESPNRPDLHKLAVNVTGCANYLVFHDYYTVDQLRLVKARTCKKSLLCAFCAARRAAKLVDRYLGTVERVLASEPALRPVMVTLTVKNGESLRERFRHLKRAFMKLQQHRRDQINGRGYTEFSKVKGSIYSYEFTKSEKGWHPHIHMVVLVSNWFDQKALSKEWQAITGDSFIVDVRRISTTTENDLASGMLEVFKYALKFSDLSLPDTWHAYQILNSRRLMGSFGNLRGVKSPESLLDDPLEHLPYLELLYVFVPRSGSYDLRTTKIMDPDDPLTLPSYQASKGTADPPFSISTRIKSPRTHSFRPADR